jgi:hypothetical protein
MPDIFNLMLKWWKQIFLIVVLSILVSAIIVFLKQKEFLSVSTAVPAPATLTDRENIFRSNTEILYPALGNADDLDLILGTARLDTVFRMVVNSEQLVAHYDLAEEKDPVEKAIVILNNKISVTRTEYGELKVKAWDREASKAAALANAIMQNLQAIHLSLRNANNQEILSRIKSEFETTRSAFTSLHDSISSGSNLASSQLMVIRRDALEQKLREYEKLAGDYELLLNTRLQPLIIVESARPAVRADKPKRLRTIAATAFISFLFAFLLVLALERKK